jgi:peptidyl-prolyl cis-trans isomerase D
MAKQPNPKILTKKHLARLEREKIQQRYLMIGTVVVLVLVVGLLIYGVLDQVLFKSLRPVAKVGNVTITSGQFINEVRFDRLRSIQQLRSVMSDSMMIQFFGSYIQQIGSRLLSPTSLGQEVLDTMVENILIANEANKRDITLSDADVNVEMEKQFGFFENGTPTPTITSTPFVYSTSTLSPTQQALVPPTNTPSPTETAELAQTATLEASPTAEIAATSTPEVSPTITLTPTITPTATPYTRDLYDKEVKQYVTNGNEIKLTESQLRDFIRKQLLRQKLYDELTKDVQPVAEQVWARHILVASEEAANVVIEKLKAGEDFASLAAELSTDTSNKDTGGDLGWFARGAMAADFENAVFALKIGEISQPIKTEFGYHIIQTLGHEERPLSAQQIDTAKQKAYQNWLTQAKTETKVETFDRWMEIVPTDPAVPDDILQMLQELQTQSQSQ